MFPTDHLNLFRVHRNSLSYCSVAEVYNYNILCVEIYYRRKKSCNCGKIALTIVSSRQFSTKADSRNGIMSSCLSSVSLVETTRSRCDVSIPFCLWRCWLLPSHPKSSHLLRFTGVKTSIGRGGRCVTIFLQIQSKFITIERGLTKLSRQQNGAIFSRTSYVRPSCHSQEMDKAR